MRSSRISSAAVVTACSCTASGDNTYTRPGDAEIFIAHGASPRDARGDRNRNAAAPRTIAASPTIASEPLDPPVFGNVFGNGTVVVLEADGTVDPLWCTVELVVGSVVDVVDEIDTLVGSTVVLGASVVDVVDALVVVVGSVVVVTSIVVVVVDVVVVEVDVVVDVVVVVGQSDSRPTCVQRVALSPFGHVPRTTNVTVPVTPSGTVVVAEVDPPAGTTGLYPSTP